MTVSPLALKVIGAGVVATPVVGLGVVYRENIKSIFKGKEEQAKIEEKNPDKELIKILEDTNKDIIFEVKKDGQTLNDLNFTGQTDPKTIVISAKISTANTDKFTGININELKKLNGDQNWTWECQVELKTSGDTSGASSLHEGTKLKDSSGNAGLFDILQKDLSKETDSNNKEKYKNVKIQFIKNCSSINASQKITGNSILRKQSFVLKKGNTSSKIGWTDSAQQDSSFYFENTELFNKWFVAPFKLTKWDLRLIDLAKKEGIKFNVTNNPNDENQLFNFSSTEQQQKEFIYTVQSENNSPALNTNAPWTWKCVIRFIKPTTVTKTELKQKEELKTFFTKLKSEKDQEKDLKVKFIEDCATFRGTDVTTPLSSNTVSSEKIFNLQDETGASATHITFPNLEEIKYLFGINTSN